MQLRRAAGLRRLYLSTRARCSIRGDTGNAELKHFFNWKTNTREELKKKNFFNPPLDASRIIEIPKDVYLCVFHRHTTFRTKVRKLGGIAGRAPILGIAGRAARIVGENRSGEWHFSPHSANLRTPASSSSTPTLRPKKGLREH